MKIEKIIIILLVILVGCTESIVETPELELTTTDVTYKVGAAVTFQLSGNPDRIYFYSGEVGKRYEYAGRLFATGVPQLQFTSLRANGTQEGSLRIMISQDFPGITAGGDSISRAATIKKISGATWTDITSRALLSAGTNTNSGIIDLSDFVQAGKPVYVALKYLASAGSVQNKWTISGLTLKNALPDGTVYTLANATNSAISNYGVATTYSPGWVFYSVSNNYYWGLSSNNLVITGATSVANATNSVESWAIMGGIDLNKVTPDWGTNLKGLDTRLDTYSYTYNTAGTYTATFVAATNDVYGKKEIVKQIQLIVAP